MRIVDEFDAATARADDGCLEEVVATDDAHLFHHSLSTGDGRSIHRRRGDSLELLPNKVRRDFGLTKELLLSCRAGFPADRSRAEQPGEQRDRSNQQRPDEDPAADGHRSNL